MSVSISTLDSNFSTASTTSDSRMSSVRTRLNSAATISTADSSMVSM